MDSMRINPRHKVHKVADEYVVLVPGKNAGEMSRVIALNDTSLYLWKTLNGKDFDVDEVCRLLTDRYDVAADTAHNDALRWVNTLRDKGLIETGEVAADHEKK